MDVRTNEHAASLVMRPDTTFGEQTHMPPESPQMRDFCVCSPKEKAPGVNRGLSRDVT